MDGTGMGTNSASRYAIELAWGGKLPSMGDFVWSSNRTLLRTQIESWLVTGMQQLRSAGGESWTSGFDQAPIWNFIVPAHVLGLGSVVGCISPSCDRVRRRFPFVVACSIAADAPAGYVSEVMSTIPTLLSRIGTLLLNGIRRQWLCETLVPMIQEELANWQASLHYQEPEILPPQGDSMILRVLAGDAQNNSCDDIVTIPHDRFSTLPWHDVTSSLMADASTSFWWTNGAGGAPLKAFTYGTRLDGALMTWLFGRPIGASHYTILEQ